MYLVTLLPTNLLLPLTLNKPNSSLFTISKELLTFTKFINSKNPSKKVQTTFRIVL